MHFDIRIEGTSDHRGPESTIGPNDKDAILDLARKAVSAIQGVGATVTHAHFGSGHIWGGGVNLLHDAAPAADVTTAADTVPADDSTASEAPADASA